MWIINLYKERKMACVYRPCSEFPSHDASCGATQSLGGAGKPKFRFLIDDFKLTCCLTLVNTDYIPIMSIMEGRQMVSKWFGGDFLQPRWVGRPAAIRASQKSELLKTMSREKG